MIEREKIAARIRALLAKTVENGCTEDEAVSAAAKAAEWLAKYNLTVDEVKLRANPFEHHSELHKDDVGERLWKVAAAISYLTEARYWISRRGVWPIEISFFGFDHEVQVSKYLLAICQRAMRDHHERLQRSFMLVTESHRRRKVLPFLDGMADALHRRIRALKLTQPTGMGLVVLRNTLIDAGLKDLGVKLHNRGAKSSRDFEDAYRQGVRAGEAVSLNQGVNGPARHAHRIGPIR